MAAPLEVSPLQPTPLKIITFHMAMKNDQVAIFLCFLCLGDKWGSTRVGGILTSSITTCCVITPLQYPVIYTKLLCFFVSVLTVDITMESSLVPIESRVEHSETLDLDIPRLSPGQWPQNGSHTSACIAWTKWVTSPTLTVPGACIGINSPMTQTSPLILQQGHTLIQHMQLI